ncbi:MAG: neutral ceramidase [Myxococcota bacterium]|jgi:neutral ceramidase
MIHDMFSNLASFVRLGALVGALLLFNACADSDRESDDPALDTTVQDGSADVATGADVSDTALTDTALNDTSSEDVTDDVAVGPRFEPTTFEVGVGRVRMPVPVGIGTAGFGQISFGGGGPKSRFAESYPASSAIYTHPTLHTVAIRGGGRHVVLLRVDLIGVTQEARRGVVAEVIKRGGPDLSQELTVSATHTHSGPGRLIDNELWAAIADRFFPEFYNRMVGAMADSVMEALADLEPATFGYSVLDTDELHNDRRCENADFLDGRLPVLRFDGEDGKVKALVMMYAVHGTIVGSSRLTLSRDFHGGMELKVEEQFEHPVTAIFFNSWSGDMSPQGGQVDETFGVHGDYNAIEAAGNLLGSIVTGALDSITMTDKIVVRSGMARVPLGLEALGYGEGEFAWASGAVYCGGAGDAPCFGEEPPDPDSLQTACIPFPSSEPAPLDTMIGMFQLGDLYVAALPGEPLTELGVTMISEIATQTGVDDVYLIGYAQDYVGYSLTEEDWFRGGYETGGSLWGPKQGDYLAARATEFAYHFVTGEDLVFESLPDPAAKAYDVPPLPTEGEIDAPAIVTQPEANYSPGDQVQVTFYGSDPWTLAPHVILEEQAEDGSFAPVLRKSTRPVSTDGYEFELSLTTSPTYDENIGPVDRTFSWTVVFPTRRGAPSTSPVVDGGPYRLTITGTRADSTEFSLSTDPFSVD